MYPGRPICDLREIRLLNNPPGIDYREKRIWQKARWNRLRVEKSLSHHRLPAAGRRADDPRPFGQALDLSDLVLDFSAMAEYDAASGHYDPFLSPFRYARRARHEITSERRMISPQPPRRLFGSRCRPPILKPSCSVERY